VLPARRFPAAAAARLVAALHRGSPSSRAGRVVRQAEERAKALEERLADAREETARREAEIAAKVEALHEREYRCVRRRPHGRRACPCR